MARKTQPLDVHQPWKNPEPHQETGAIRQHSEQQETAKGPAPESILNRVQGGDRDSSYQEHPKKYELYKRWKTTWNKWEAIEKFTFVLVFFTFFSSAADIYQSYLMSETLIASQRPTVYLGLPDGKIADFISEGGKERIALYFRNYGQSTARNVFVEVWSVTWGATFKLTEKEIPPPGKVGVGPDVPPGLSILHYQPFPEAIKEQLETGKRNMLLVGRVQYADSFRMYCEAFSVSFARLPVPQFVLTGGSRFINACDSREDVFRLLPPTK